jgi:hypothetical protein
MAQESTGRIGEIDGALEAIAQKAATGALTLGDLQSLASESVKLQRERDGLAIAVEQSARDAVKVDMGKVTVSVPSDAKVRFTLSREGDNLVVQRALIVSPTLDDAIYKALGAKLLTTAESVKSIKSIVVEDGVVTVNAPTAKPRASNGNGNGGTRRETIVNGVTYNSAAAAYRGAMGQDLPHPMNGASIEKALINAGHTIGA